MSDIVNLDAPQDDLSGWTIDRLGAHLAVAESQNMEAVRLVAQNHAYQRDEPRHLRLAWAKLSLQANQRTYGEDAWQRARATQQNFGLRAWVIDHIGPDDEDPNWNPATLATDTLAALTLGPADAREMADQWPHLAIEKIGELRRHKNLTAHLDTLARHLQPGPIRDQTITWLETRQHLP